MPRKNRKGKLNRNRKIVVAVVIVVTLFLASLIAVQKTMFWFNTHEVFTQQMLVFKVRSPIKIQERKPIIKQVIMDYPEEIDTPLEEYIVQKFGVYEAKTALAVFKSESGLNCEAMNVNNNRTVDYGVAQMNSIHWDRFGGLKNLITCEQQIDAAHVLWTEEGWYPWVVFNNGSFKGNL